jgi:putative PEP-CTERM system TPR-repeat lipoprotein
MINFVGIVGRRSAVAIAIAAAVAACSGNDPSKFVASAELYFAKKDYPAAIIELKNAIAGKPDDARARFLLGSAFLQAGDPVAANTELRKALALGYAADEAYPLIARALTQQKITKADLGDLEKAPIQSSHAKAQVAAMSGIGYLALGQNADARKQIESALAAEPANVDARIAQATLFLAEKDVARSSQAVDRILAENPDNVDALMLKVDLLISARDTTEATRVLERMVALYPQSLRSRYMLASMYVRTNALEKATAQVDILRKAAPGEAHTLHAIAMIAFAKGDMKAALDAVQKSLELAPDYLPARYLSGLIDLKRGAFATAEHSLRTVVAQSPEDDGASIALAATLLRRGQAAQAQEAMEPALKRSPDNVQALRLAGEIQLAQKAPARAADYIARANNIDNGNIQGKVRLAEVRLAKGDTAQGLRDLEALSAAEANAREPGIALVGAYMRTRNYPKALGAADALIANDPVGPIGYNTKGAVYMAMGDYAHAREQFEKALAQNPDFVAAAYGLARLDTAERNFDSARARYLKILNKLPQSEPVLLGLADILVNTGAPPDQVAAAIQRAVSANPDSANARIALINYYAQQKNWKLALTAAQAAQSAIPDTPAIMEVLAAVQLGAEEGNQAIVTYTRLSKLDPENPVPLMRLAGIQAVQKNYDAAIDYMNSARIAAPDNPAIWVTLASLYHDAGKSRAGLAQARNLQKESPKQAVGFALEAEVLALDRNVREAAAAYRAAILRSPPPLIVLRYYTLLTSDGKEKEAMAVTQEWLTQHPQDVALRTALGQRSLDSGDCAHAIRYYRDAAQYDPSNAALLNNLAWCLAETNSPEALDFAERAYRIAPSSAAIANTYGWVLFQRGDITQGIRHLRRSTELEPDDAGHRIYLAKALIKSGDKDGARKQLELAAKGDTGRSKSVARQLLESL